MALVENRENKADIVGNNNVVIQGCNLDNITITPIDTNELVNQIEQRLAGINEPLHIFVIATIGNKLKTKIEDGSLTCINEAVLPNSHHDTDRDKWKPFVNSEPILDLLKQFQELSGFNVNAFILDFGDVRLSQPETANLQRFRAHTIYIIDALSLVYEGNKVLLENVIAAPEIGGCLIPVCEYSNIDYKEFSKTGVQTHLFPHYQVSHCYADDILKLKEDTGYVHIDLAVPDKNMLFRRLTAIATLHLPNSLNSDAKKHRIPKRRLSAAFDNKAVVAGLGI
jgi:hypothetical protein